MTGKAKGFETRTQRYLKSLPAVDVVTSTRIYYTDEFRREVMRRYEAGGSPTEIFREAGLDPKIVGYKRIERAIARWKDNKDDRDNPKDAKPSPAPADGNGRVRASKGDPRDRLIVNQALRIAELEQHAFQLEQRLHALEQDELS